MSARIPHRACVHDSSGQGLTLHDSARPREVMQSEVPWLRYRDLTNSSVCCSIIDSLKYKTLSLTKPKRHNKIMVKTGCIQVNNYGYCKFCYACSLTTTKIFQLIKVISINSHT